MSQYIWTEAKLTFKDNETLQKAVQPLRDGGWLQDNNQMLHLDDDDIAGGESFVCISGNTLTLPSEQYLNLGRCIDDVVEKAESGFCNSNTDDGDLWIACWKDGKWKEALTEKTIAKYIDDDKKKDYFLLDDEEFEAKYECVNYWGERSDVLWEATENFIKKAW